jgi:hypothetical protein
MLVCHFCSMDHSRIHAFSIVLRRRGITVLINIPLFSPLMFQIAFGMIPLYISARERKHATFVQYTFRNFNVSLGRMRWSVGFPKIS